jgi:hypothetical protein
MAPAEDERTVARFVLRARRIEAHSLVQDWDELTHHAEGSFNVHIDISGAATVTQKLPQDEEAFESLAARVRPLTLDREPIHHKKVVRALSRLIDAAPAATDHQRTWLQRLRQAWQVAELQGTRPLGYSVQSVRLDGSDATPLVSDTQLAAGWLYADLVHADATGPKAEALRFSMRERYAAAVRVISRIAALAVSTLRLIEHLRDAGVVAVPDEAWDGEVVVGTAELVNEATLYVGEPGSDMPDLREADVGRGWAQLTVTELLRQRPENHVRVVLTRSDGSVVADYAAAVARRHQDGDVLHWYVLVAGSDMVHVEFHTADESVTQVSLAGWTEMKSTNQLMLASARLRLEMYEADTMAFEVGDTPFVTLTLPDLGDALIEVQVRAETLADIVVCETILGQRCEPCLRRPADVDRVQLRWARLILEGHVVETFSKAMTTTVPNGTSPQAILVEERSLDVGGALIPVPRWLLRHPAMTSRDLGSASAAGPDARRFEVTPPQGQRFLAWSPERRVVQTDDELAATAPWGLTGIDETTFPY